jgi:hypothetical protein
MGRRISIDAERAEVYQFREYASGRAPDVGNFSRPGKANPLTKGTAKWILASTLTIEGCVSVAVIHGEEV